MYNNDSSPLSATLLSYAQVYADIFSYKPQHAGIYSLSSQIKDVDYSDCQQILDFLEDSPDHPLAVKIVASLAIINRCFNYFAQMALSFNGGKDATVVLHLVRTYCLLLAGKSNFSPHQIFCNRIVCFVIHTAPYFKELADFFLLANQRFNLRCYIYQNFSFRAALQNFTDLTQLQMCFLGVRKGDPQSYRVFNNPSPGWPQITRVSPALHFSFVDVFDFLLRFNFQYCELYNCGFTSLGDSSTKANANITGRAISKKMKQKLEYKQAKRQQRQERYRSRLHDTNYLASGHDVEDEGAELSDETVADALIQRGITYDKIINRFVDEDATPAYCISLEESETERSGRVATRNAAVGRREDFL